jgi:FkbH-like protein
MDLNKLKAFLRDGDPQFWPLMAALTRQARDFEELFLLSSLRKKAYDRKLEHKSTEKIRLAVLGGYSLYPLHELIEHLCEVENLPVELWKGDYDNYIAEIMDEGSALYSFAPEVVFLLPSEHRCTYTGKWTDERELQEAEVKRIVDELLALVRKVNKKTRAEIIMANFMPPARHDPGTYRTRTLGSDWNFRKRVNMELGLNAPSCLRICDLEYLAYRIGGLASRDERGWFESKQPCSPALMVEAAREVTHLIGSLKRATKKVLVLDLDNTLWGGVIGDDGLEGIELGDTSPRGEAFKAFQKYIASLKERGVLLAVCSKNDYAKAIEPFEKHPEMALCLEDIVSFKANWESKADNIRLMAAELNLGLDSFAFVDDNPAEIEIVRQFAPEVTTILLGPDPAGYVTQLQDCRLFEPRSITVEDAERTNQYRSDVQRKKLQASVTDMDSYLESLAMEAVISEFTAVDVPRLSQLINKSNQFNLITRRRSEAEVIAVMNDPEHVAYSMRLKDRFGDHGLISVVIGKKCGETMHIDTWLMSCRVLKRQVEEEILNELARLARARGCTRLEGIYLPTAKNEMVRDFYSRMGFSLTRENGTRLMLSPNCRPFLTRCFSNRSC